MANKFEVRSLRRDEMLAVLRLTDQEGWNVEPPSLHTGFDMDKEGWIVAVNDKKEIIGLCAAVTLNDDLAMVVYFVVDKNYRRQGIGSKLWKASTSRLEGKNILLTAKNTDLYRKDGFIPDQVIQMWSYKITSQISLHATSNSECNFRICDVKDITQHSIGKYDQEIAPYDRSDFFENYIIKGCTSGAVATDKISGGVLGYGILKKGSLAWKINPIYAENDDVARKILKTLLKSVPEGETVCVLPFAENKSAVSILKEIGFIQSFTSTVTSMYNRYRIPVPIEKTYSVSSIAYSVY